jgi:hypothetical protein
MAGWIEPEADIALPKETNAGVFTHLARNDGVGAAHGDSAFPGGGHAGAGFSVGRNGVVVYEHGANYFAPRLVHAAALAAWTHVAVVDRDDPPSLYLNGQLARQGTSSTFKVHSSAGAGGGSFMGERGEIEHFNRALSAADIAELAKSKPPAAAGALPTITMTRGAKGILTAEVASGGDYGIRLSSGQTRSFSVPTLPSPWKVAAAWEVRFHPNRDVPERVTLERLMSLTEHPNEAIRHFAGTATYRKTVELPANHVPGNADSAIILDLGRVEALAEVILNGRNLGVLRKPRYVLDLTSAAQPGANTLEVRVTGTWRNRLIGAARHPNGFSAATGQPPPFQPYLSADLKVRADEPLTTFGLIGPVRLHSLRRVEIP